jgi:two-component system, NarL family, invasion response regulator UvrY
MTTLLIADDHPIVREGLKSVVSQYRDLQVVGEAADAETAIAGCKQFTPDVLLLDVSMPGPGVLEVIRRLRAETPSTRILVLSIHPEQHYARRVLKAGADGYVTKNYTADVLYSAIRQVRSGHKYVTPALAEEFATELAGGRNGQPHERLSNREYEVFLQLGSGRSVDQIARQLAIKPKTVRSYRARILEKTMLKSTAELIFYAVNCGLVTEVYKPTEEEDLDEPRARRTVARPVAPPVARSAVAPARKAR